MRKHLLQDVMDTLGYNVADVSFSIAREKACLHSSVQFHILPSLKQLVQWVH